MRTDVGTFVFRIPSPIDGAKITVEYANSTESIVFHLSHHLPDRTATVQVSGLLLEIEAKERLIKKVWQDTGHEVAERVGKRRSVHRVWPEAEAVLPVL